MINLSLIEFICIIILFFLFTGFAILNHWFNKLTLSEWISLSLGMGITSTMVLFTLIASLYRYQYVLFLAIFILLSLTGIVGLVFKKQELLKGQLCEFPAKRKIFQSIIFWGFIGLMFYFPASVLYLPAGVDAMGWGLFSVLLKKGGSIFTLAPYYPDIQNSYPPGFFLFTAFFSTLWNTSIPVIMVWLSHFLAFLVVYLSYTLGKTIQDSKLGYILAVTTLLDAAIYHSLIDTGYTAILGLVMIQLFLIFLFYSLTEDKWVYKILSSLSLTGLCFSTPDLLLVLVMALIPFFGTLWLSSDKDKKKVFLILFQICLLGLILASPWFIQILKLVNHPEPEKYLQLNHTNLVDWKPGWHQLGTLLVYHNPLVWLLALIGIYKTITRRTVLDILMLTWLVVLTDLVWTGFWPGLFHALGFAIDRHVYYFTYAWRGPIIPLGYFSGMSVYYLWKQSESLIEQVCKYLIGRFCWITAGYAIITYAFYRMNRSYGRFFPILGYLFLLFLLVLIDYLLMESQKTKPGKNKPVPKINWIGLMKPGILFCGILIILFFCFSEITSLLGKKLVPPFWGGDKIHLAGTIKYHLTDILRYPPSPYNTQPDYDTMAWLKENTPDTSFILNIGSFQEHWLIPVSERKAVYFRDQPFFVGKDKYLPFWQQGWNAYRNPGTPDTLAFLQKNHIEYIFVPENESSDGFDKSTTLELACQNGKARIYKVKL